MGSTGEARSDRGGGGRYGHWGDTGVCVRGGGLGAEWGEWTVGVVRSGRVPVWQYVLGLVYPIILACSFGAMPRRPLCHGPVRAAIGGQQLACQREILLSRRHQHPCNSRTTWHVAPVLVLFPCTFLNIIFSPTHPLHSLPRQAPLFTYPSPVPPRPPCARRTSLCAVSLPPAPVPAPPVTAAPAVPAPAPVAAVSEASEAASST